MEQLVCRKCGLIDSYTTEQKQNNLVAHCSCGAFIKNIPTDPPKFYFGKYKGLEIERIDDVGYLEWARDNMNALNRRTYDAIVSRINSIKSLLL